MAVTPDPSVRALIAQWRERARKANLAMLSEFIPQGASAERDAYENCADELEAALTPLADLEAEMRRVAEAQQCQDSHGSEGWNTRVSG